ncbi:nucleoside diphosphate kinase regulator [Sphingobium sp. SJ10-10]|uniref:nucleoside diphosphate kinase regulator n=1 Tax=Sphingobium sp. SJ10-10 TaxID=3114999 RepID=UPI002E174634|nr:nucleoside diphosphate kinase regulator [Sphingobium sp. SJ10-10]
MSSPTRTKRPVVRLINTEADILTNLALNASGPAAQAGELLLEEIARASTFTADRIPADVVTMHSMVEFEDAASGTSRTVQLVYPAEADISAGRMSILTPVGAGLIGLSESHVIDWPDRNGRQRPLTILKVTQRGRE